MQNRHIVCSFFCVLLLIFFSTGDWRHLVCVLGAEDVYEASRGRSLFINKFDVTLDSTGPICLRQQLDERVFLPNSLRTLDNADREPNSPPKSFFQKPESLAKP